MYDSVRLPEGANVVLFKPRLVVPVHHGDYYEYVWDSRGGVNVAKLTEVS